MEGYKSSTKKLVRLFKKSRDAWKEKAIQRQKKIKALGIKVRDLIKSREYWKRRAKQAERELKQLKGTKKDGSNDDSTKANPSEKEKAKETCKTALSTPAGHVYPVFIIQLAIQQVIESLSSLRGCQKNFSLFSQFFSIQTPTFNTIRNWVFRLGLYELQKKHEYRSDWIVILDLTIELGQAKCLVILGIPAARLRETGYSLQHQDVSVLHIAVLSSTNGQVIGQELINLQKSIGRPLQIIADHGSDLKKGIEIYQRQNPEVIYTYDVTHKMALLLKHELETDERFQSFLHQCRRTRQRTQQTELYFLIPPKQRVKSRYLNLETHVRWAQQVLAYQSVGDFSQISRGFMIDESTLLALSESLKPEILTKLESMKGQVFDNLTSFVDSVTQHIGSALFAQFGSTICQAAEIGRKKFTQKLGWLQDYQSEIEFYSQLIELVNLVQKQLKQQGLNHKSKTNFYQNTKNMLLTARAQRFKARIESYLTYEQNQIPDGQTLLATSDIIESIFGKYKLFSKARPLKEVGKILLIIPVFTASITSDLVKRAMEEVRTVDVEEWGLKMFGQSMLSKRRAVFEGGGGTKMG